MIIEKVHNLEDVVKDVKAKYPYVHLFLDNYAAKDNCVTQLRAQVAVEQVKQHYGKEVYKLYEHVYNGIAIQHMYNNKK